MLLLLSLLFLEETRDRLTLNATVDLLQEDAPLDLRVPLDTLEREVRMEDLDSLDVKELMESLLLLPSILPEDASNALLDLLELPETPDSRDPLDSPAVPEDPDPLETLADPDPTGNLVLQANLADLGRWADRDLLVLQV